VPHEIFSCPGGSIVLPDPGRALVDRTDGGNLLVNPPRPVWERGELTPAELTLWSFLIAATGTSMLETLPQLEGGCINYWEAGNWALNDLAEPAGPKLARQHRSVHMHLLGRSPRATHPDLRWGEAPKFPDFTERLSWMAKLELLTPDECQRIVAKTEALLVSKYSCLASP
jgi:hypothetical protein